MYYSVKTIFGEGFTVTSSLFALSERFSLQSVSMYGWNGAKVFVSSADPFGGSLGGYMI